MQEDEPTFARSVVNASYLRRKSYVSYVKPIEPSQILPSERSTTLKVKQYLNQLAKQEKLEEKLEKQKKYPESDSKRRVTRSGSLDVGRTNTRIFEYKVDSNKLADSTYDICRSYSVDPDLIKPIALKPLVFSNPDVSISEALGSELFASGSIPSNKEIDHILEVIKSVRQRTLSEEQPDRINCRRPRRHSDISDLTRSGKRSIKDPPSKSLSRRSSINSINSSHSNKSLERFGSSCSAFKSIQKSQPLVEEPPAKPARRCSQPTIVEEEPPKASRLYPILSPLEEHMPDIKPHIPQKQPCCPVSSLPCKIVIKNPVLPPITISPPHERISDAPPKKPLSPANVDRVLGRTTSDNSQLSLSKSRRSYSSSSSTYSGKSSTRDNSLVSPTKGRRSHSSSSTSPSSSSPDDLVLQHTLMRKARQRHQKCSQPCIVNNSDDEAIDNHPAPRFSPNTHPRAQLPSHLATCSGNHPPVSYLNSIKRSKSLQVNHIEICDDRTFHKLRSKQFEQPTPSQIINVPQVEECEVRPLLQVYEPLSHTYHQEEPSTSKSPVRARNSQSDHIQLSPNEVDEVKQLLKKVGRKYLTDTCTLQTKDPEIEKKHSLSFVFSGNKDLQDKVRHFFLETNKNYCKRLIKQRFESNPSDFTPDSSVVDAEDLEVFGDVEMRHLPNNNSQISPDTQRRNSKNVDESIHSFLTKSDNIVSNKCDNHSDHDKLKKDDLKDILERLKSPPVTPQHPKNDPLDVSFPPAPLKRSHTHTEGFTSRPKFNSANSSTSGSSDADFILKRNGSKASRDSGYGDSTSASNEGLDPKPRARSSSLTILSKLRPLFLFKSQRSKDSLVPDQDNPFNNIFDDHPISDLTKSLDNMIDRRCSLQDPVITTENNNNNNNKSPDSRSYSQNDSVFDSPVDKVKEVSLQVTLPQNHEEVLNEFNSLFGSATSQVLTSQITGDFVSEDDEEFRVSPLPEDAATPQTVEEEVFYIVRARTLCFRDTCTEPYTTTPVSQADKFSLQDIQEILDSYDVLQTRGQNSMLGGSTDREYHKVHNMLQSKVTVALSSIYHTLINSHIPLKVGDNMGNVVTLENTLNYLDDILEVEEDNADVLELVGLLESFETMIQLHDEIISRTYYENETLPEVPAGRSFTVVQGGEEKNASQSIFRMVGLHKNRGEPLGITLKKEGEKVVVHRILAGGMIDRQRLLHLGDEIISINGTNVEPRPDLIQNMLRDQEGDIQLKIIPSYKETTPICQVYVKAHFNYDPKTDNLMPCKEAGLPFKKGDILQIVNQDDANWWQAKIEGGDSQAGLIPGQILQEQRMAANGMDNDKSSSVGCGGASRKKKNKKMNYSANKNSEFDQHEINLYEEVAKMPPFNRKTLVLIGAQGVGRRSLISKLVLNEPDKFGNTMPHTSRPVRAGERDGGGYWFTSREKMNEDIGNHQYLEYGEYEAHLYGTKLDSIRQVMRSGKMCLLDVNPQSLKVLKTSEFVPFIVFIEAPPFEVLVKMHKESARDNPNKTFSESDLKKSIEESKRLKRQYSHYFDEVIQNNNMDDTYEKLYRCISKLSTSPQWVPVSWVY